MAVEHHINAAAVYAVFAAVLEVGVEQGCLVGRVNGGEAQIQRAGLRRVDLEEVVFIQSAFGHGAIASLELERDDGCCVGVGHHDARAVLPQGTFQPQRRIILVKFRLVIVACKGLSVAVTVGVVKLRQVAVRIAKGRHAAPSVRSGVAQLGVNHAAKKVAVLGGHVFRVNLHGVQHVGAEHDGLRIAGWDAAIGGVFIPAGVNEIVVAQTVDDEVVFVVFCATNGNFGRCDLAAEHAAT